MSTIAAIRSDASPRAGAVSVSGAEVRRRHADVLTRQYDHFDNIYAELFACRSTAINELEVRADTHVLLMRCEGMAFRCEIVWPEGGHRQMLPELGPGSIVFSPPASRVRVVKKDQGRYDYISLQIPPSALEVANDFHLDSTRVSLTPQAGAGRAELCRILFAMRDEIRLPGPVGPLYKESLALQLIVQLLRCQSELAIAPAPAQGGLSAYQLRRALELLEADLTRTPSLRQLAEHVGLSPSHLCTAFKQSTGHPPYRYLLRRRLAHAKTLMAQSRLSLTEIALSSGFGSSSQFANVFRRINGTTPTAYRRSL